MGVNFNNFFSNRFVVLTVALAAVFSLLGLNFIFNNVSAAVTESRAATELLAAGQKIKASSNSIPLFGFGLTKNAAETLTSVAVKIASTTAGIDTSSFAEVGLFADTGSPDDALDANDALVGTTTVAALNSTTTIPAGGYAIPASASGTYNFFVAVKTSAAAANGESFSFIVSGGVGTYILSAGTVNATGLNGSNSLTIDTVTPSPTGMGGPPNGQAGVPVDALVDRQMSENLAASSISSSTVLLQANTGNAQGGAPAGANLCISATLQNNNRVVCNHMADSQPLTPSTWYTFSIGVGVTDAAGNPLAPTSTYAFQTGSQQGGGTPPPFVLSTVPGGGAFDVATNARLRVYFSQTMASGTSQGSVENINNIQLIADANSNGFPDAGETNILACSAPVSDCNLFWGATEKEAVITPGKKAPQGSAASTGGSAMSANTNYLLIVKAAGGPDPSTCSGACVLSSSTPALSLPGMNFMVPFRTGSGADSTGPLIQATYPASSTTGVAPNINDILVSFNEGVDPADITTSTVLLFRDSGSASGTLDATDTLIGGANVRYSASDRAAHLSPNTLLAVNDQYLIHATSSIRDIVGNTLGASKTFKFTTAASFSDTAAPSIGFANADNYGIFVTFSEGMKKIGVENSVNWTLESPIGVQVNLTGKAVTYDGTVNTLKINGLSFPPGQVFKITGSTSTSALEDLSGNDLSASGNTAQGTVQNGNTTGGQLGPGEAPKFDFAQMGMNPVAVFPKIALASTTSAYRAELSLTSAIPSGGTVVLTFPTGFGFATGGSGCETAVTSFENDDINGPAPNTVTMQSIACDSVAKTITITTSGAVNANDMLRFEIQGIINSPVPKDFSSGGYTVDIKTKNTLGTILDSKTSMPFFLSVPGTQSIAGTVFNDNGVGGGTASNGAKEGSEPGVAAVKVCLASPMVGFQCQNTDVNGAYSFGLLSNGFYNLNIPPLSSGSFTGGPFFRDISLAGGASTSSINFALRSAVSNIRVTVTGIPANADLDIFAMNSLDMQKGGFVVREVNYSAATANVTLPVADGRWQVGVGPKMPKESGSLPPPPVFNFMPPKPQEVVTTSGTTSTVSFSLIAASARIVGKVIDGSGSGIPNAFVLARPSIAFGTGGATVEAHGGVAQSGGDGSFTLNVINGAYVVDASMPGMPPSAPVQITVKDNTGASDGNSSADVYVNGTLVDGSNLLYLKVAKGGRSISGKVLDDSGNPIKFAHVSGELVDGSGNPLGRFTDAPTNESGLYTLYVDNGTWKIRAFAPGFGELPAITVTVAGSDATDKNIRASTDSFGTLLGRVTKGGASVQGAFVGVHGANGGNGTVTDANGNYSMKVRSGTGYTVDGFMPGSGPLAPVANVTISSTTPATVNFAAGNPGILQVTISGVADAFVDARDSNGVGGGTGSNPTSGIYEMSLPAGNYTVKAGNPKHGNIGTATTSVYAASTTVISMTSATLVTISGSITSSSGSCLAGVNIFMSDTTGGRFANAVTNSSGAWSLTVPTSTYRLGAGKQGCIDSENPSVLQVSTTTAGLARTMLATNATISGKVTADGSNVTVATKVVADNGSGKYVIADVNTAATSTNNYTLSLSGGTWTVKARSDGFESATTSVSVADGGSAAQNLAISAISGYVRKEAKSFGVTPLRGGLVTNNDIGNNFQVNIPGGALGTGQDTGSVLTTIKTTAVDTATAKVVGGKAIEITPKDASGQPITSISEGAEVTISIPYSETDVTAAGGNENKLIVGSWSSDKQQWDTLPTTVDTASNVLTAKTTHFSDFAPLVPQGGGAPSQPTGFGVSMIGPRQINLSWNAVSDVTGYDIYRDTSSGGSFPRLGSEPTVSSGVTNYSDTSVSPNTTYYYRLSAVNASGESSSTSPVQMTTSGVGSPAVSSVGGASSVPATTAATTTTIATTTTAVTIATTATSSAAAAQAAPGIFPGLNQTSQSIGQKFLKRLAEGARDDEVWRLQQFLAADSSIYPEGIINGKFGPLTKKAVQRFQEKHGIAKKSDSGYGEVGPKTRAKINEFIQASPEVPSGESLEQPGGKNIAPGFLFGKPLSLGLKNDDVTKLQELLKSDSSLYPEGLVTGYFGPATLRALQRFQEKHKLAVPGDLGYGYAGPKTRAKLNELLEFGAGSSGVVPPGLLSAPGVQNKSATAAQSAPSSEKEKSVKNMLNEIKVLQQKLDELIKLKAGN